MTQRNRAVRIVCDRHGCIVAIATRVGGVWDIADAYRVGRKTRDDPIRTHAYALQRGQRRTFFDSPIKHDHSEPAATARAHTFRCRDCGREITRRRKTLDAELDRAERIGAAEIRVF